MQTLDILQSAEWLAKHQATQEDQSIDSLYRVEVPRIQELQLSSRAGNSTIAMPPGYHSPRGGPIVIPSILYLLQGATQVQWTRREGTLQARETDCWRRFNLWLASTAINRILNTLFSAHFSPFPR